MSTASRDKFVAQIHNSGRRLVLLVTGGGSLAIPELLQVPGGSRSIIEATVPYSAQALAAWLGAEPEQYCSERTARAMAVTAYRRGQSLHASQSGLIGIGCTASLVSERPKRGAHRVHVAGQTSDTTTVASLTLDKGRRTRSEEEQVAANAILNVIAELCALGDRIDLGCTSNEPLERKTITAPESWQLLFAGETSFVRCNAAAAEAVLPAAVFPGAFNPVHAGHQEIAAIASDLLEAPITFELSIENVDKPALDYLEVEKRLTQFRPDERVWLTRASTFVEKAAVFPGTTFIVGADTIARIAVAGYYGGEAELNHALQMIASAGCRFLVFGRASKHGFQTLDALKLPPVLAQICTQVPASRFRRDITSSDLRKQLPA